MNGAQQELISHYLDSVLFDAVISADQSTLTIHIFHSQVLTNFYYFFKSKSFSFSLIESIPTHHLGKLN